jgi:preprotein translocase subunit YajC
MFSGIVGRVVELTDERARVEVAPGVEMTFLRGAVSRRLEPGEPAAGEAGQDRSDGSEVVDGNEDGER